MFKGMKSVVLFEPKDSREERINKFAEWRVNNKLSAVGDKYVPGVEETRAYLERIKRV